MAKLVIGTVFDFKSKEQFVNDVKEFVTKSVNDSKFTFEDLDDRLHYSNHFRPSKDWEESEDAMGEYLSKIEKEITFADCIEFLRMFGQEYIEENRYIEEAFRDDLNETFVSFKE